MYYQTEFFDFASPKQTKVFPFHNPYIHWDKNVAVKANFHAHSISWKGLTNGHNSDFEIHNEYKKLGFSVASITNYHTISKVKNNSLIYIPCYEHGYNITKSHVLAIDAAGVNPLDFPLGQGISQKQLRIQNIKKTASLVALAHPGLFNGYTMNDLKYLRGYDLFEALSPYGESVDRWDHALNNGIFSWIMANDDTHDLNSQPAGRYFNLIAAESRTKEGILRALKKGNHIAYSSSKGEVDVTMEKIILKNNTIFYSFSGNIHRVKLIRNGNTTLVDSSDGIILNPDDNYIRFVVEGETSTLYSNPIFRMKPSDLEDISSIPYVINTFKTTGFRLVLVFTIIMLLVLLLEKRLRTLRLLNLRKDKWKLYPKSI